MGRHNPVQTKTDAGRIGARGGLAIVIAHRPSAIKGVDYVLFMGEGGVKLFGDKEGAAKGAAAGALGLRAAAGGCRSRVIAMNNDAAATFRSIGRPIARWD